MDDGKSIYRSHSWVIYRVIGKHLCTELEFWRDANVSVLGALCGIMYLYFV